jgi:hypothetical protein
MNRIHDADEARQLLERGLALQQDGGDGSAELLASIAIGMLLLTDAVESLASEGIKVKNTVTTCNYKEIW